MSDQMPIPDTRAMPNGTERPGEHWNARLIRDAAPPAGPCPDTAPHGQHEHYGQPASIRRECPGVTEQPAVPYTDADVEIVAGAIAATWGRTFAEMDAEGPADGLAVRDDARRILDALAAAGRLAPVDELAAVTATAAPGRHVLAVADSRAWEIEHPAGCTVPTPTGAVVICLVHDLAVEQLRPARMPPPGRYEVWTNDLGDLLCIGDRLPSADAANREG